MMPSAPPQPPHAPGNGRRIAFALAAMAMMSAGLYGLIEADVIDLAALLTMILLAASAMAWAAMTFARPAQHMGKPELKTDEALRRIDISSIWPLQNAAEGGHSIPKRHHDPHPKGRPSPLGSENGRAQRWERMGQDG